MNSGDEPSRTRLALLRKSIETHSELAAAAARGEGIDQHLFALHERCSEMAPDEMPALFSDDAYALLNSNTLSTSVLTSDFTEQSVFGPVVVGGYGVCYMCYETELSFAITCMGDAQNTGDRCTAAGLVRALEHSLHDVAALLEMEVE